MIQRRGAAHSFADLDPAQTALVVIDLQHAFVNDAIGFAAVPAARDIVPAVNRLAAAVRETGGGVFWIKMTHDDRCFSEWSVAYELPTPEYRAKRIAALSYSIGAVGRPARRQAHPPACADAELIDWELR